MNELPLDYLMRETIGDYDGTWPTCTDKLKNCILFTGASFTQDRETLYSLYVHYVGTDGSVQMLLTNIPTPRMVANVTLIWNHIYVMNPTSPIKLVQLLPR